MASEEYLHELSRYQGAISTLLGNMNQFLKDLPDKRDQEDLIEKVQIIISQLKNIEEDINTQELVGKKFDMVFNKLENLADKMKTYDAEGIDELIKSHKKVRLEVEKIMTIIKIQHPDITPTDIVEVIKYTKRVNKKSKFWEGTKAKVLIVSATVGSIIIFGTKIVTGLQEFIKLIQGWF